MENANQSHGPAANAPFALAHYNEEVRHTEYDKHDPDEMLDELSSQSSGSVEHINAGTKQVEAVAKSWTVWSLAIAYIGLFLMTNSTSLEGQSTYILLPIATSNFSKHSLLAAVATVQQIVLAVAKPPIAQLSNAFGRLPAFCIAVLFFVIGYILDASSQTIEVYAAAVVFYAIGSTGIQVLVAIFVSDTSNLKWRTLAQGVIQYLPFIWTYWVGSKIGGHFASFNWRWGYGVWAIVLPAAFIPLLASLIYNTIKAKRLGVYPKSPYAGQRPSELLKNLWIDLDFFGLILLCAGLTLLLLPLALANEASNGWRNPSMIAMIVLGGFFMVCFAVWERVPKLAPKPFFARNLFRTPTVLFGVTLGFFYFFAYYMSVQPYFSSYLIVVIGKDLTSASYISLVFTFTSSVTAIIVGVLVAITRHIKYWVVLGSCVYIVGIGLMIKYRDLGTSTGSLIGTQICVGIGGGILNLPALLSVQASVSHSQMAAATAVFLTIVEVGGACGAAVSGAIWTAYIPAKLNAYLPEGSKGQAAEIFGSVTAASGANVSGYTPEVQDAVRRAYNETMHTLLTCAVCLAAPPVILSLLMKNHKLGKMDQKVAGLVIGGKAEQTSGESDRTQEDRGKVTEEPIFKIFPFLKSRKPRQQSTAAAY